MSFGQSDQRQKDGAEHRNPIGPIMVILFLGILVLLAFGDEEDADKENAREQLRAKIIETVNPRINDQVLALLEDGDFGSLANFGRVYNEVSEASTEGKIYENQDLQNHNFRNADLSGAIFRQVNLKDADFRGANLEGALFGITNLEDATFRGACLLNARFLLANLDDTEFRRSYLVGTEFTLVDDEDAEMERAITEGEEVCPE